MDTKTVCHGWERDPYDAVVEDGRLWGHGVMDMKAGLASLVASAAAMHDSGAVTRGKVRVAAVCGHMAQQEGSVAFFERYPDADLCILGELSDLRVYLGHRGRIYFDVTTKGHAAHTYLREQAISAVNQIARAVLALDAMRGGLRRGARGGARVRLAPDPRGRPRVRRAAAGRALDDPGPRDLQHRLPRAPRGRGRRRAAAHHRASSRGCARTTRTSTTRSSRPT